MSQATNVKQVLIAAKWILENIGWCKGVFGRTKTGTHLPMSVCDPNLDCACLLGAIEMTDARPHLRELAIQLISNQLLITGRLYPLTELTEWNDAADRTKKEVIALLNKAIKQA